MVDVRAVERFPRAVTLSEMRTKPELEGMPLLQKGSRLSVQKVGAAEWNEVLSWRKRETRADSARVLVVFVVPRDLEMEAMQKAMKGGSHQNADHGDESHPAEEGV